MSEDKGFSEESLRKIAAQKISFRYSVRIHLAVYILVNILLFAINFITAPSMITFYTSWFVYPLLGWFVGLSIHAVSYIMFARGVYPIAKRGVIYHFTAYLTGMILLVVTNLQTLPIYLWVLWPGIFWSAAIIVHVVIYLLYFKAKIMETGDVKSRKEQAIEKEMEKMRKKMNREI
ncbi:MAG: 2TM domain-containing protein [Promethearchaeota archaeon]